MIIDAAWTPPPMLKHLPRDSRIIVCCKACELTWTEPVRDLVEKQHMGAVYLDLLEMQTRCLRPGCRRAVTIRCDALDDPPARQKKRRAPVAAPLVAKPRMLSQLELFGAAGASEMARSID